MDSHASDAESQDRWQEASGRDPGSAAGCCDTAASCGHYGKACDEGDGADCTRRGSRDGDARRDQFPLPLSFSLFVQLVAGSFCCGAAACMAPVWLLPRVALAFVALGGFSRLYLRFQKPSGQLRVPPIKILVYTAAAIAVNLLVGCAAMAATAAHVAWKTIEYGVGREPRRWYATLGGLALDGLELGALALQMILMTQWVFGEFSVMPVMTTMGMMFTLFHNFSLFVSTDDPLFWRDDAE
mmetsp:Transcript_1026/g.2248  ORF Transcript_1026/g.2248 Transcript_1026/m.2248 type:complete len:241 (+) Transcript_1026:36-758(+)|eukprot:CAMPEP_0173392868 /NCGR_PEP_ID=MMETSP1356-20130122/21530_1 /TAXON_ID=77927 ORGANISM="Hemiselmis virescens, Strain PCC157" /NCGR_SAMPLE_ID=MMETSP1356 /ASSEMBLY_ACC=CAM_ASM_000847 /LENGTH=240 /DNA_ID=CAMNT_0014350787 /DNA_START=28 /DNA_END=750 /DNA_ORIENTATION=-